MSRGRLAPRVALGITLALGSSVPAQDASPPADRGPNVVLIFTDDQGYADLGCYGAKGFETPRLDALAASGVRFTDFYVAQAVCGASRAALLTGCYANRVSLLGAPGPGAKHGIHADETTLAELLKARGYATAMFGKWHLGHHREFLPTHHGFDEYCGLPYSNDMWPKHPTHPKAYPPLPWIEGDEVTETDPDQTKLTRTYTDRAIDFIERNADGDRPFFCYVAHSMPHVPLFGDEALVGTAEYGRYGDILAEIDREVGRLLDTLERLELTEDTLVVFTSDNGPWLSYGDHAGSAGPLREGKGTAWEGGVRVPCLMSWPGRIPADRICRAPAMTIDVLPTIAEFAGAPIERRTLHGKAIDGESLVPWLLGHPDGDPHEALYFWYGRELRAVRQGSWKLVLPHRFRSLTGTPGRDGKPAGYTVSSTGLALFDLTKDPGERTDLAAEQPEAVARLAELAAAMRPRLGDRLTNTDGAEIRPAGRISGR